MAFEECDLVFTEFAWRIGIRPLHAEVIVDFACVDGCAGLGDKLGSSHCLAIPVGSAVQGNLDSLSTPSVCRVLEGRVEVYI